MDVADKLQQGLHLDTNESTAQYLDSVGLSNPGTAGSQEAAQRNAISAVGAVDPTGLVLKKWALAVSLCLHIFNYLCIILGYSF